MEEIGINAAAGISSTVNAGNSPRSKQKKKSLCQLLMNKKTKVGCLGASYKDEERTKPCRLDDSQHGSQTSTKFTLCCARTERSSTPPQSLTISRLSAASLSPASVRSDVASVNGDCQTTVIAESAENQKTSKDRGSMTAPSGSPLNNKEEGNISVKEECFHGTYFQGEQPTLKSLTHDCLLHPRPRLTHRTSADNFATTSPPISMKHSSPESVRSAPGQMKARSTSQEAIAPKKNMRHMAGVAGASMDSLAKNALIAAKVFNLIPAQKARERNFLHGRCAATSLLGSTELEKVLPNRELKIFIGTWNMNGQTPPKELNDFMLPSHVESVPDMLAIGTQESCSERFEWEAALQETLGPTHVLLSSTGLGTLHLALFLRRDLIWYCSVTEEDSFSTRTGSAFRTKGAVALGLILFGTSFLFVTAHLTAHQDKVKERVSDIKRIVRNVDLPKELPIRHKSKDVTQNFDCVFWCGDLNFRLAQPREEVIQWVTGTSFPQQSPVNLHKDQLRITLNEGAVLRGFEEAPITFPPTYKYDPGTQNFDSSSKQRTPAYTDRILYKSKNHNKGYIRRLSHESTSSSQRDGIIECLVYDSVPSICTSDHKPVWGVFKTTIRPGVDTIPLSAGYFNREVYAEGIKRRVAAMDEDRAAAKVCSMQ